MPLSHALLSAVLSMPCPHCGHKLEMPGRWFQTIGRYECEGCHQTVRVRYGDKVKLFDDHAHLIQIRRSATTGGRRGRNANDVGLRDATPQDVRR